MKKLSLIFMAGLFLFVSVGCGASSNDSSSDEVDSKSDTTNTKSKETKKEEAVGDFVKTAKDATFDGTTLKGNTYTIKITDHKVIQPGEAGNEYGDAPVIAFWYDTLVAPDYNNEPAINPSTAWIMNFTAVQDNDPNKVNKLNISTLPDQQFLDSQTAEIKPGGTVSNAVAYTLTDTETPVTLTAEDIMGTEFGTTDFAIK